MEGSSGSAAGGGPAAAAAVPGAAPTSPPAIIVQDEAVIFRSRKAATDLRVGLDRQADGPSGAGVNSGDGSTTSPGERRDRGGEGKGTGREEGEEEAVLVAAAGLESSQQEGIRRSTMEEEQGSPGAWGGEVGEDRRRLGAGLGEGRAAAGLSDGDIGGGGGGEGGSGGGGGGDAFYSPPSRATGTETTRRRKKSAPLAEADGPRIETETRTGTRAGPFPRAGAPPPPRGEVRVWRPWGRHGAAELPSEGRVGIGGGVDRGGGGATPVGGVAEARGEAASTQEGVGGREGDGVADAVDAGAADDGAEVGRVRKMHWKPKYLTVKAVFFLFYSSLGAIMPYLPVYYHSLGIPDRRVNCFAFFALNCFTFGRYFSCKFCLRRAAGLNLSSTRFYCCRDAIICYAGWGGAHAVFRT